MKVSPKGPFRSIRWFCKDGTEIASVPGKGSSCAEHGGGVQHGEWSEQTRGIRDAGYLIGNVLADIDVMQLLSSVDGDAALKHMLLEQYLISVDDGWILRGARFYRGALQMEDERRAARRILRTMLQQPAWRKGRFPLLREAVRLLPHEAETGSLTQMRSLSSTLAEADPGFSRLRDKLHNLPDAGDAEAVRSYAQRRGVPSQAANYVRLAYLLDQIYQSDAPGKLRALAAAVPDEEFAQHLRAAVSRFTDRQQPGERLTAGAAAMVLIRDQLARFGSPGLMLDALDASLAIELEMYSAANAMRAQISSANRGQLLRWLSPCVDALYGAGLLSQRERNALNDAVRALDNQTIKLGLYDREVRYLARTPTWAENALRFDFADSAQRLVRIEPLVQGYFHDRLRGSPLLLFGELMTRLLSDVDALSGIHHVLFGRTASNGIRALNPGLARGKLLDARHGPYSREGIYIVEETIADLPPVAGILTAGVGNPVSHVQLLARNLAIPNVLVSREVLESLRRYSGEQAVLAVSPRGTVHLERDGPQWDAVFNKRASTDLLIHVDPAQLDLERRALLDLAELRAADAGRFVGPKAANLGELKRYYPAAVSDGVVIPMGVFRQLLARPLYHGGPSVWDWMQREYAALGDAQSNGSGQTQVERAAPFLARLRQWILAQTFDPQFALHLRSVLEQAFGPDGSYGVFVRSDTNVEDLPGFSGAGLNLTVPNVVGSENIMRAIFQVWASPFSERAYSWRQARMDDPMQVFPSVLLLRSVAVEKSGVLVTRDLDSDDNTVLSVAVNEGIGGAVAGQAAEELRIDAHSGRVRLMASAAAAYKLSLRPEGGLQRIPVHDRERVLTDHESRILADFARALPDRYPGVRSDSGGVIPMDIEFGFAGGDLALFQIRPFAQNKRARENTFLLALDSRRADAAEYIVNMDEKPR